MPRTSPGPWPLDSDGTTPTRWYDSIWLGRLRRARRPQRRRGRAQTGSRPRARRGSSAAGQRIRCRWARRLDRRRLQPARLGGSAGARQRVRVLVDSDQRAGRPHRGRHAAQKWVFQKHRKCRATAVIFQRASDIIPSFSIFVSFCFGTGSLPSPSPFLVGAASLHHRRPNLDPSIHRSMTPTATTPAQTTAKIRP